MNYLERLPPRSLSPHVGCLWAAWGYFDQSHLLRDFRQLAGGAPWSLDLASGDLSRHLIRPERLRVLLADS